MSSSDPKSNTGTRKYVCDECEKPFKDNYALKLHVKGVHLKLFKCENCKKSFNTGSNLNRHVLNKHGKIRHPCDLCDANYSQKGTLAQHRAKWHPSEEKNIC